MLWLLKIVNSMSRSGRQNIPKGREGQTVETPQEEVPEEEIPIRRRKSIGKLKDLESSRDSLDIKIGGV